MNFFNEQETNSSLVLYPPNCTGLLSHIHDTHDLGKVKKISNALCCSSMSLKNCSNAVKDRKQKEMRYMDN